MTDSLLGAVRTSTVIFFILLGAAFIFIVLVVEMAQITPPVGFNQFVVQNLTGKDIFTVAKASFPFFLLMVVATVLVTVFSQIVLSLPRAMTAR